MKWLSGFVFAYYEYVFSLVSDGSTKSQTYIETKLRFTCSKSTVETFEKGVKYVQS